MYKNFRNTFSQNKRLEQESNFENYTAKVKHVF